MSLFIYFRRKKHIYGAEAEDIMRRAQKKVKTGMNQRDQQEISRMKVYHLILDTVKR